MLPTNFPKNTEQLSWKESFRKLYKDLFHPLLSDEWRREYLMAVGLNPDRIKKGSEADKKKKAAQKEIEAAYKSIDTFQSKAQKGESKFLSQSDIAQWMTLFKEVKHLYQQIRALIEVIRSEDDELSVEDYLSLLVDLMTVSYFRLHMPALYILMQLTGVIVDEKVTVSKLLDTLGDLDQYYDLHTETEAREFSDAIFLNLAILFIALIDNDQVLRYGWDPLPEQVPSKYPQADLLSRRMLSLYFDKVIKIEKDYTEALETTLDLSFLVLPENQGGPLFLLYMDSEGEFILRLNEQWSARIMVNLPGGMLQLGKSPELSGDLDAEVRIKVYSGLEEAVPDPITVFETDSASFRIGKFLIEGGVSSTGYDFKAVAKHSVLELSSTGNDGFLNAIIGEGTQLHFDFGIGYGPEGWYLVGGVGLNVALHLNKKLFGLTIRILHLGLNSRKEGNQQLVHFESSLSFRLSIGPVLATVERLGLQIQLPLPKGGFKDIDADQLDFGPKWPTGVGFSVDAKVVKGGGFLRMDPEKGEYLGFAELKITELFCLENIALKALAIINTKLPDGQDGYSFLMMISTEFDPVQLGAGFTLNGVGGMIGLHRGLNLDKITAGIKGKKYDYLLFPKDPLANLPLIITGLNDIMPIKKDHHTFGLMGIIGWGTPQILEIKIGLLFEAPAWRFALIGIAKAEIKRKKKVVARLRLDFAIIYDPAKSLFAIDGKLNYSKLLLWKLSGDVAVRIKGGDDPFFLFCAGGFHKSYTPPDNLYLPKKMERMKLVMAEKNPKIQAELFFAFTPNSVQLGMSAHASYKNWGIGFEADLGFAALLKTEPFEFQAEVWGSVYLKFFGASFGLELRGTVKGPRPWLIDLWVTFKIWIWKKTVRVPTIKVGEEATEHLDSIEVAPILVAQLEDERNWQGMVPAETASTVSLRATGDGTDTAGRPLYFHPIGDIHINQSQVPLNRKLDRFGHHRPGDFREFTLELEGLEQADERLMQTFFAPAQYFELSEEEVFQSKPFERYDSGVNIRSRAELLAGSPLEKPGSYEEIIFDVDQQVISRAPKPENEQDYEDYQSGNSLTQSTLGKKRWKEQTGAKQGRQYHRKEEAFTVVDNLSLHPVPEVKGRLSEQEARQLRDALLTQQPALAGRLEVIPWYEVEEQQYA